MSEEQKSRTITVNIGWLAAFAALLVSLVALYGTWNSSHTKSILDQVQDDSAYARATRAVAWIDKNDWRFNFIGPKNNK